LCAVRGELPSTAKGEWNARDAKGRVAAVRRAVDEIRKDIGLRNAEERTSIYTSPRHRWEHWGPPHRPCFDRVFPFPDGILLASCLGSAQFSHRDTSKRSIASQSRARSRINPQSLYSESPKVAIIVRLFAPVKRAKEFPLHKIVSFQFG